LTRSSVPPFSTFPRNTTASPHFFGKRSFLRHSSRATDCGLVLTLHNTIFSWCAPIFLEFALPLMTLPPQFTHKPPRFLSTFPCTNCAPGHRLQTFYQPRGADEIAAIRTPSLAANAQPSVESTTGFHLRSFYSIRPYRPSGLNSPPDGNGFLENGLTKEARLVVIPHFLLNP